MYYHPYATPTITPLAFGQLELSADDEPLRLDRASKAPSLALALLMAKLLVHLFSTCLKYLFSSLPNLSHFT